MLDPEPAEVPPHEPVYHCHIATVPKLPPVTFNVLEVPLQVLLLVIVIPVGADDRLLTVTAKLLAALVPQLFPAVTVIIGCPRIWLLFLHCGGYIRRSSPPVPFSTISPFNVLSISHGNLNGLFSSLTRWLAKKIPASQKKITA